MENFDINKYLTELFYNPKYGFGNLEKIYYKVKQDGKYITKKQIKEFLEKQKVNQIYKENKKPEKFSSIIANGIKDEYQMDIMIYDRYEFNKYKYVLFIIDIYSRYAEAYPMTNRENKTILKGIEDIFNKIGKPKIISCDNEFDTKDFKLFCEKENIQVNFSIPNDIQKNSIVERLNRTIAGYFKKLREIKKYNWVKYLPDIMDNYNNSFHRTIRNTPYKIFFKNGKNKQDIYILLNKFQIGDNVRFKIKKKIFDKGDIQLYSNDIYTIKSFGDKKVLLSNGKYYTKRNLRKVENIVDYEPNQQDLQDKENFNKSKQQKDLKKILKKEGLDNNIIINEKRNIKKRNILNL
jgi:putative transposase